MVPGSGCWNAAAGRVGAAVAVGLPGHSFLPGGRDPKGGTAGQRRRHHLHESVLQRAVREAALSSGVPKRVSCHTMRHHADCRIMLRGWRAGAWEPCLPGLGLA